MTLVALDSLDADLVEGVRAVLSAAVAVDGVESLGEQPVRALSAPAGSGVLHLVVERDGRIAGYAQLTGEGAAASAELGVHPDHRRTGLGRDLVSAVWAREPRASVWAHGNLPAATALAAKVGARRGRELLKMQVRATGVDVSGEAPSSTGLEIGTFADADSEGGTRWPGLDARAGLLGVNNAAFDWHPEQGGWTRARLDERLGAEWVDPAGVFLAVDPDPADGGAPRVAGFHWTKVHPDGEGEVYVVGVDPSYQGRHLGSVLTDIGLRRLVSARGCPAVVLYVEGDNTPALRTYERLGFTVAHRDVTYLSV